MAAFKFSTVQVEKNHAKVDFFDIFIFNNVKSDLKTILCQQNKVVFKVKVLPL